MTRRWWHRPAAILLVLGCLGVGEALCALLGWGSPDLRHDPFVGFRKVNPLFVLDRTGSRFVTAPSRRRFFPDQSFARHKRPETFRIFCFGGSTVQGNPYAEDTAFPTWLRFHLQAAEPDRNWEVINCGGISYASYRLANIVQECTAYEPDLFVLCTGHNEFLEDRTYARVKLAPQWFQWTFDFASRFRLFNGLRDTWIALKTRAASPPVAASAAASPVTQLRDEVDAWLDYAEGLKVYHRDESWREGVIRHFEFNVRRMIALARTADVPILLIQPTSNLRDCPPFKSQHGSGFSKADLPVWQRLVAEAQTRTDSDPQAAAVCLQRALAIDGQYALTHYQLGHALDALGRTPEAKQAYLQARELDICPLRILASMERALGRIARDTDTPLINAQRLIELKSPGGIPGKDWLLDHIHPSIAAHQLIARRLFEVIVRQGWIHPRPGWEALCRRACKRHMAALPGTYFDRGQAALKGLRAWTRGRASGPAIDYRVFGRPSPLTRPTQSTRQLRNRRPNRSSAAPPTRQGKSR